MLGTAAAAQLSAAGQAREAAILLQYPPPGRMVDVGGRRLHIQCKGPERGPTVILETGALASALYYWTAQDAVAKVARACVYDRAGAGWSDPAPYPRTFQDRARDLHDLIRAAGLKRPVILVGHSMGGEIVRFYAKAWPRDLAGLVLVEPSNEAFNGRADNVARVAATVKQMDLAIAGANAGVEVAALKAPMGPPEQAVALRAGVFRAGQDDLSAMTRIADEARAAGLGPLGRLPLVVVSRGKPDPGIDNAGWLASHRELAKLSTRSVHLTAERSGHMVNYDEPEMYRIAVEKVLELAKAR